MMRGPNFKTFQEWVDYCNRQYLVTHLQFEVEDIWERALDEIEWRANNAVRWALKCVDKRIDQIGR